MGVPAPGAKPAMIPVAAKRPMVGKLTQFALSALPTDNIAADIFFLLRFRTAFVANSGKKGNRVKSSL